MFLAQFMSFDYKSSHTNDGSSAPAQSHNILEQVPDVVAADITTTSTPSSITIHNTNSSVPDPASRRTAQAFLIHDLVYCREGPKSYPAIVREVRQIGAHNHNSSHSITTSTWEYFIHYKGWNSRWDQWKKEEELSRSPQKEAISMDNQEVEHQTTNATTEHPCSVSPLSKKEISEPSSIARDSVDHTATASANKLLLVYQHACELPLTLKIVLVQEGERIREHDSLHSLAHNQRKKFVSVHAVLQAFFSNITFMDDEDELDKDTTTGSSTASSSSTMKMLTQLFEHALPKCLLYNEREQSQYEKYIDTSPQKSISETYPAEFVLRFWTRLPYLLVALHDETVPTNLLQDFVVFLQQHRNKFFLQQFYQHTS